MPEFRTERVRQLIESKPRSLLEAGDNALSSPSKPVNNSTIFATIFGEQVFGRRQMEACLPKPVFSAFLDQICKGTTMDKSTCDAIAHAARVWAQEKGATHFTHWFQPHTNSTAEKHDSFLSLKMSATEMGFESTPIDAFSGSSLLQAEPDASSFPNGGARTTFEARGYTVWDPSSPMFIQKGPHGTSVLYIPSIFLSYNGDALDEKTGLLRSIDAVAKASCRLIKFLGNDKAADADVRVIPTLGCEQEFFLIDRSLYAHRPDLRLTGRTLLGKMPPKHQQLEDHYFGNIPSRVLAAISEAELELWKLGVPIKTRHNEVAPNQFEVAPIFEDANISVDHNLLTMEVIHKVAHRHNLKALFHEKPFAGVNGSGKHCNWSLLTSSGVNMLEPGNAPEENILFLATLLAVLMAVQDHGPLLRAAVASASNDHRLGANEAPPAIVSVFLGAYLSEVLNSIENGQSPQNLYRPTLKSISVGRRTLDVKLSSMPEICQDPTDRNRTSPFAFTGNKFEFRAVGSKQSPSFPVAVLNSGVAEAMNYICDRLESGDNAMALIRQLISKTKSVRFEGDNYSKEWEVEAERRGLLNIKTSPNSYSLLSKSNHREMLIEKCKVYSEAELNARFHVLLEKYAKDLLIESRTMVSMVRQFVLPVAFKYRRELMSGVTLQVSSSFPHKQPLEDVLSSSLKINAAEQDTCQRLSLEIDSAYRVLLQLESEVEKVEAIEHQNGDPLCQSLAAEKLTLLMSELRVHVDKLEELSPDEYWQLPKYSDIFFN